VSEAGAGQRLNTVCDRRFPIGVFVPGHGSAETGNDAQFLGTETRRDRFSAHGPGEDDDPVLNDTVRVARGKPGLFARTFVQAHRSHCIRILLAYEGRGMAFE
jgi:hypothetical protein